MLQGCQGRGEGLGRDIRILSNQVTETADEKSTKDSLCNKSEASYYIMKKEN